MILRHCYTAVIVILIACSYGEPVWCDPFDDLILITESLPPLNYKENGILRGISVDLMDKLLSMVGSKLTRTDIKLMPWARAYRDLLEKNNTVLFLMDRNQARETLFKWVGPVVTLKYVMIAKKENGIRINSVNDLKSYRIGVVCKDVGELLMEEINIPRQKLECVSSGELNLNKLNRNRIDLWNYDASVAKWIILRNGYKLQDYEIVYILNSRQLSYFAFNRNTDDTIISKFQNALDLLKNKSSENALSEFDKIVQQYKRKGKLSVGYPTLKPE